MSAGWEADKRWSDRFIPEMAGHLGRLLICEPPVVEDREHNSDLMVLGMNAVRIGCRIRTAKYRASYGHQFTIRSTRPSGQKTELRKIAEGWGDYFFYGFASDDDATLAQWFIGDLTVFRGWFTRSLARMDKGQIPGIARVNGDRSSAFAAFNIADMPDGFVRAGSGLPVAQEAVA